MKRLILAVVLVVLLLVRRAAPATSSYEAALWPAIAPTHLVDGSPPPEWAVNPDEMPPPAPDIATVWYFFKGFEHGQ